MREISGRIQAAPVSAALIALRSMGEQSFRPAVIVNFTIDMEPTLLFVRCEMAHELHQIADYLFANAPDQSRTFRRTAAHDLTAVHAHHRAQHLTHDL